VGFIGLAVIPRQPTVSLGRYGRAKDKETAGLLVCGSGIHHSGSTAP
jgi:hypothetical protein